MFIRLFESISAMEMASDIESERQRKKKLSENSVVEIKIANEELREARESHAKRTTRRWYTFIVYAVHLGTRIINWGRESYITGRNF